MADPQISEANPGAKDDLHPPEPWQRRAVEVWYVARVMALRVVYLTDGRTRMWARPEFCCGSVVSVWYVLTSTRVEMVEREG